MRRATILYLSLLFAFLTVLLFAAADFPDTLLTGASNELSPNNGKPQTVSPPVLKGSYNFAGEEVPIADDFIRDRLDRELLTNTFYHSSTQHILKRKDKFFAVIEPILAAEGVPDDLKYIAVAESAFRDFRSPAGAAGVWHFMKGTAKDFGLEVNSEVDERYHLEKATRAAARYLKALKEDLGTWTLAAAAYNMGANGLRNRLQQQRAERYYELTLNQETARYVYRIVALKDILQDPTYYGFYLKAADKYEPVTGFAEVTVTESVANWGDFARKYGTDYRTLKDFNPWLRDVKLTVSAGNSYQVRVPRK